MKNLIDWLLNPPTEGPEIYRLVKTNGWRGICLGGRS